jgi:TPR repeat protein
MSERMISSFRVSLVVTLCLSSPAGTTDPDTGNQLRENEREGSRSVLKLESQAARGNLDAMYLLAMMHVEGDMPDANYDTGIAMLKKAAIKGHADSQRMYHFMDNAFSGEGC